MTDDLTRGYEEQDGSVTESAEATTSESGAAGAATMVGQAGETVVVNRPAPGQTVEIQAAPGQTYVLNFTPGAAQVQVDGDNFILAFDDNGDGTPDSQVVFLDLANVADSGNPPVFQVAGVPIGSDVLLDQALALAGDDDNLLDVAAGPGAIGGGATEYSDNLGDILDLLVAQGVIPPVELEFGLIDVEPDPILVLEEAEVPLLINEIGVRVALKVPGSEGPIGEPFIIQDADTGYEPFGGEEGETAIPESLPFVDNNGTLETAQVIDRGQFGIAPSPNVGDDSDPRVQINGIINSQFDIDFYCFQFVAGETVTFDIDFGEDQGDWVDIQLWLYDASGNLITDNDDADTALGGAGSIDEYDSYIQFTIPESGVYYIGVTAHNQDLDDGGIPDGNDNDETGDYVLQVSIDNFQGASSFPTVDAPVQEELQEYNFIELINTSSSAFDPSGLTVQVLGEDLSVSSFTIPGSVPAIPAGGFIVFYQLADAQTDGTPGTEDILWRVFDSSGDVVSGGTIADGPFWGLGDDTTDAIGVNLLTGGESVDTFAANITDGQLGGLTDPEFGGAPEGFGSPLLDLNFDTFNGQFTGNHHIFSRVDLDDTDSQSDWTTNNIPTDGALNDITGGLLGGDGPFNVSYIIDVSGSVGSGPGSVLEDEILGILALNQSIIDAGLAGQVEISVIPFGSNANDTVTFSTADGLSSGSTNPALNGLTLAQYLNNMPTGGGTDFEDAMAAARDWFLDGDRYVGEDNFVFFLSDGQASFNPASFPEFYDPTDPNFINAVIQAYGIGAGADLDALDLVDDGTDNDSAIAVTNPDDLEAVLGGATGGESDGLDRNPWDPLNDDLDPDQNNPDPLAGQNFLQAAAGGDLVEGRGGPDFLLGAGGNDSLYGGSQELYLQQTDKMVDQVEQMYESFFGFDGGEGPQSAAELNHGPAFSDHNDFLFGDQGDDEMYGGSGGDYMIGGQGNDSMDGGTGDDQIYGDGSEDIGGLPADDLNHAGDDVIAGDALNNGNAVLGEYGEPTVVGGEFQAAVDQGIYGGATALAGVVLGGNDTIIAGNGDDMVSGDALAEGVGGARAFAYSDDSVVRPEDGFSDFDQGFGNDTIRGDGGNDSIGGDATAISHGDGGEGSFSGFAGAEGVNLAVFGDSDAPVGSDSIDGGEGHDAISGDALAISRDSYYSEAGAESYNIAEDGGEGAGASAGDDVIVGDGGDGGEGGPAFGNDSIAGDAGAFAGAEGFSEAYASAYNNANASGGGFYGGAEGYASAGNDSIDAGAGNDVVGGDALAMADIYGGDGFAGAEGYNEAHTSDYGEAKAGDDTISGDGLTGAEGFGGGSDAIAGDTGAIGTEAEADTYNHAGGEGASAGNDSIDSGSDNDTVAGGSLAIGRDSAYAHTSNYTHDDGRAGNDTIDTGDGNDLFAGDSLTIETDSNDPVLGEPPIDKTAETDNDAYSGGESGSDDIDAGSGNNIGAGDSAEFSNYAHADTENYAQDAGSKAGDDTISADGGDDTIAGGSLARGEQEAYARTDNDASEGGSAGNDVITSDANPSFSGAEGQGATDTEIEDFLGLSSGALDALADDGDGANGAEDATAGSAIKTSVDVQAGDKISFNFNFLESEDLDTPPVTFQDFAFVSINGELFRLSNVGEANDPTSASVNLAGFSISFSDESGWLTFEGDIAVTGTIEIGFGVLDEDDSIVDAGLLLDDLKITRDEGATTVFEEDFSDLSAWEKVSGGFAETVGNIGTNVANPNVPQGLLISTEDPNQVYGDDVIAGDSASIASDYGGFALAETENQVGDGGEGNSDFGVAGSDIIDSGPENDLVAGDSLAKADGAEGYTDNVANGEGAVAGDDTIDSGEGNDTVAGGSLAKGVSYAYAETDNNADNLGRAGNDSISTGEGDDLFSGDSLAIETAAEAEESTARTYNTAEDEGLAGNDSIDAGEGDNIGAGDAVDVSNSSDAVTINQAGDYGSKAGDDTIVSGNGDDSLSGGSMALGGEFAYAYTNNNAWDQGSAGNDLITSDGGEGAGNDVVAGDSYADAEVYADADTYNTAESGAASGNDEIFVGEGDNMAAGESFAMGRGLGTANAYAQNVAVSAGSIAGNDTISAGNGDDTISGGAQAKSEGGLATATNVNSAFGGASAGDDSIIADGGASGDDVVAGDAQALSESGHAESQATNGNESVVGSVGNDDIWTGGYNETGDMVAGDSMAKSGGTASAYGDNVAHNATKAGDDTIVSGAGHDTISGGALASAYGEAYADQHNVAEFGGSAGNDSVRADDGDLAYDDEIAGDAMARSESAHAQANSANDAALVYNQGGRAGNDTLDGAEGNNAMAGDAMAVSGTTATADADNTAYGQNAEAGDDFIDGGEGNETISGDAQARATGTAEAYADNIAKGNNADAGNDDIDAYDGFDVIAGDAQAESHEGNAGAYGTNIAGDGGEGGDSFNEAGNDYIWTSGLEGDVISGGAQASAAGHAYADQYNHADGGEGRGLENRAGNDTIWAAGGDNQVAGDAQAIGLEAGSTTEAFSENLADGGEGNLAGNDRIDSWGGADGVSGDAQAISDGDAVADATNSAFGNLNRSGNDEITAGDGENVVAGEASAISNSNATAYGENVADGTSRAGNDEINVGSDNDTVSGGAQAIGDYGAYAQQDNTASDSAEAGNDTIAAGEGDNVVAGDAVAISDDAEATANNTTTASGASAGNDNIVVGDGADSVAGDALADGDSASATTNNTAAAGSSAGSDTLTLNGGANVFGGDSLTVDNGGNTSTANNTADGAGAKAGDDTVTAGDDGDTGAGDAAEISGGAAQAVVHNDADNDGSAGSDTLYVYKGDDTVSGGSLAKGDSADADTTNDADSGGSAGNDLIVGVVEAVYHSDGQVGDAGNKLVRIDGQLDNPGDYVVVNGDPTPDATNSIVWSGRSIDGDGYMRVYNDTGAEVTWYVASVAGPDAGEYFEVTIPANSAVVVNIGQGSGNPGIGINNTMRALDAPPPAGSFVTPTAQIGDNKSIDTIANDGSDVFAGDAMAVADGSSQTADADSDNTASDAGSKAGDDTIYGGDGENRVSGDAMAIAHDGTADATADNTTTTAASSAGNDNIVVGDGADSVAGDALADGDSASATTNNTAAAGSSAGSDTLTLNGGANVFGGDSLTVDNGGNTSAANNTADGAGAKAGDDTVTAGDGGNLGGGDAAEISAGEANATVTNDADNSGSAGNDDITTGSGSDTLSGGALASGVTGAIASAANNADTLGTAGGDTIVSGDDIGGGGDDVAGDAMAVAISGTISATAANTANTGGSAGDDSIVAGEGNDRVSGEATADGENALADVDNIATSTNGDGASAGDDTISGGANNDTVSGGGLAAGLSAVADVFNKALASVGLARAGNDDIDLGSGGTEIAAGDALATGEDGEATVENDATASAAGATADAGNDTIDASIGSVGDILAGDGATTHSSGGNAEVDNGAYGYDGGVANAGNDSILAGFGDDTISGGSLAAGEDARASTDNEANADNGGSATAGSDEIYASEGADTVAGDALATGTAGYAEADNQANALNGNDATADAGSDLIDADDDNDADLLAGDAASVATDGGDAVVTNEADAQGANNKATAGNDTVLAGGGNDTISGGALAAGIAASAAAGVLAEVDNTADAGDDSTASASAGDDSIEAAEGDNTVAGDALTTGDYGTSDVENEATATDGATASAGDDTITAGAGADDISGDALATGDDGVANATNTSSASSTALAGSDDINAGGGSNEVAGDAAALGAGGTATATNTANTGLGLASSGDDTVSTGSGSDTIAGEALSDGDAKADNDATAASAGGTASAGNDTIDADTGGDGADGSADLVAGEALSYNGNATAENSAAATQADDGLAAALAGNDRIDLGVGDDVAAGEAVALGDGAEAKADNDADVVGDGGEGAGVALAGNDLMLGDEGSNLMAGEALARGANGSALADNDATSTAAFGAALAGNDLMLSEDGNDSLAGDALASNAGGTALAENTAAVSGVGTGDLDFLGLGGAGGLLGGIVDFFDDAEVGAALAGNDVIAAASNDYGNLIAGDALSSDAAGGTADADNTATVSDGGESVGIALAGNDAILSGHGSDTIAGDALAVGANATADNLASVVGGEGESYASVALAGNDLILSEFLGEDDIIGGEYGELIAGEAMSNALDGLATANNTATINDTNSVYVNAAIAGSDLIVTDFLDDTISGGSLTTGDGGIADTNNTATVTTDAAIGLDLAIAGGDIIDAGAGDNLVAGDALSTGDEGSTPTATADNTATTTFNGTDGAEGLAISSAGDDGIGSPFGGILGEAVSHGYAYDQVLGTFGINTGGLVGGLVGGIADAIIDGGDGHDTISGDALASGATGVATANNAATTDATLDGGQGSALASAGNDVIDGGNGENLLAGDAMASNAASGNATANNEGTVTAAVSGGEFGDEAYLFAGAEGGSDFIAGGIDSDVMSGDALAAGEGSTAEANNTATGTGTAGDYGSLYLFAGAGNDVLLGDGGESGPVLRVALVDGGEGGLGDDDTIAGDALATNRNGTATANNLATAAGVAAGYISVEVVAGGDFIDGAEGNDLLAGDAMTSHAEGGDATANNTADADGAEGTHAHAGDDDIFGSFGDDTVAGDALAAGEGSTALANNQATASGDALATSGSDYITVDSDGADIASGGALASGANGLAKAVNTATASDDATAHAGDDVIYAGNGSDTLAGDALASGAGGVAEAYNTATATDTAWAGAGNDRIEDHGVLTYSDPVEAVYHSYTGGAEWFPVTEAFDDAGEYIAVPGNGGNNLTWAGRSADGDGYMRVYNPGGEVTWWVGSVSGADAGTGYLVTIPAGGAVILNIGTLANGNVMEVWSDDPANGGVKIKGTSTLGDKSIDTVELPIPSDDVIAGDALATGIAIDDQGGAKTENTATVSDSGYASAGDDTIIAGAGDDLVSGGTMTTNTAGEDAINENLATVESNANPDAVARAGNDWIAGDYNVILPCAPCIALPAGGDDTIAGDALTAAENEFAIARNDAIVNPPDNPELGPTATAKAGDDTIDAGDGQNVVSGDAMSLADVTVGVSPAFVAQALNTARGDGSSAGNDKITVGDGGEGEPFVVEIPQDEIIIQQAFVGDFEVNELEFFGSRISGDALASGDYGDALAVNDAEDLADDFGTQKAGNDSIFAGDGGNIIAGDALATGKDGNAVVNNNAANAAAIAIVGSDYIESGDGNDLISGDAMATGGGDAVAQRDVDTALFNESQASDDTIYAGGGDDIIAGDALSIGGTAAVKFGGDDYIDGGDGNDTISGDVLALGDGSSEEIDLIGGDDTLLGGDGDDVIFGDSATVTGNGGDDVINGGLGNDTMTGGDGADTFVFDGAAVDVDGDVDTITDFDLSEGDVLDLSDLLVGVSPGDDGDELDDYLSFSFAAGDTTITVNIDGSGGGAEEITIELQNIDLTALGSDEDIINNLLGSGNLVVE